MIPTEPIPEEEQSPAQPHNQREIPPREERAQAAPEKPPTPAKENPPRKGPVSVPAVRFVKRANRDKAVRSTDGKAVTDKARPLHLKYKILPKEELLRMPEQRHGHRQMPADTGPKTKNQRARARIAKVMSHLHDDD